MSLGVKRKVRWMDTGESMVLSCLKSCIRGGTGVRVTSVIYLHFITIKGLAVCA